MTGMITSPSGETQKPAIPRNASFSGDIAIDMACNQTLE